jgi:hypothetical protein
MNVVGALCVGRLGRANDPSLCPPTLAPVLPCLTVPTSAPGLAPRQRPPHERQEETRRTRRDTRFVRCVVVVVVVDHQRQPINRSINYESNQCNRIAINYESTQSNQLNRIAYRIESKHPIEGSQPDQPRHDRHKDQPDIGLVLHHAIDSRHDQQPANRSDREMERRKIALGKIALGNRPPPGPPPPRVAAPPEGAAARAEQAFPQERFPDSTGPLRAVQGPRAPHADPFQHPHDFHPRRSA